MITVLLTSFE